MGIGQRWTLTIAFLFCAILAAAPFCEYDLLTPAQRAAVEKVRETHGTAVLRGVIDGVPRTIVLVGEVHVQSDAQLETVRAMLEHFALRGVESYPGGLLWKIYSTLALELEGLARGQNAGSTITEARRKNRLKPDVEVFRLEEGFRPNWREWFASWMVPSYFLAPKVGWLPAAAGVPKLFSGSPEAAAAWVAVGAFGWIAGMAATMFYQETAARDLRARRDPWMAATLYNKLAEKPQRTQVLGIVGRSHLRGMTDWLKSKGFEIVSFTMPPTE